jgi:hypothetical protein
MAFYERGSYIPGAPLYRQRLVHQLKSVPTFRRWIGSQFGRPRVCTKLRRTLDDERITGQHVPGMSLWLNETDRDAEPYLDGGGNLAWRAKLVI